MCYIIDIVLTVFFLLQQENLWQKKQEDELQRNMTQLSLLEKHKNAIAKKSLLFAQQSMVTALSELDWCLDSRSFVMNIDSYHFQPV